MTEDTNAPSFPFTPEAVEAARVMFARPVEFVMGAADVAQLPAPDLPEVAFAGRSNVGKSSLINALVSRSGLARASSAPGRTQQVNIFLLDERLRLVDLPGYGFAKAPKAEARKFQNLGRAYLSGRPNLKRVYLLIDARHGLKPPDAEAMDALDKAAVSYQIVLTKADKLKPPRPRRPPPRRSPASPSAARPSRACSPPPPRRGRAFPSCAPRSRRPASWWDSRRVATTLRRLDRRRGPAKLDATKNRRTPMNTQSTGQSGAKWLGALGLAACLVLAQGPAANAQETAVTAQTLVDRAQIEDLLTTYYYNLGHSGPDGFSRFYADGAELVLGPNSYKGKDGIANAYKAAGKANPGLKAYSFQVLLNNPLIVVHGDTATAQLIFTEVVIDKQGDKPHLLTQGREYDHLVKVGGQWRFQKRQITPGAEQPAGWPN